MDDFMDGIRSEFARYRALAESALHRVDDAALHHRDGESCNSIAVVIQHLAGNLTSRFTDFLQSDGEKPWRDRDAEFREQHVSRAELLDRWRGGWSVLETALADLSIADLDRRVTIRGRAISVCGALLRSLAHTAYHVGQVVHMAKIRAGRDWQSLSIPMGASSTYNLAPDRELGSDHAVRLGFPPARPESEA